MTCSRNVILIIFLLTCSLSIHAQDYKTAVGIRFSAGNGITVKHMLDKGTALEGILITRWRGFYLTGLYEIVKPLSAPDRLYWYYGFGAHVGSWDGDRTPGFFDDPDNDYFILGIDGILGMEYTFSEVPINLSLDWKPALNLIRHSGFWADEVALSVRFAIGGN